ncbi:hypothetical protein GGR58DRAFT_466931 [Xylaria digitata]|nr:hypothetical protein GGR58DRAFT_466931 [Xylaria digitata]
MDSGSKKKKKREIEEGMSVPLPRSIKGPKLKPFEGGIESIQFKSFLVQMKMSKATAKYHIVGFSGSPSRVKHWP